MQKLQLLHHCRRRYHHRQYLLLTLLVMQTLTSTTTTTTSTTQASTTIPVYVIPVEYSCLPINDTYAVVNSSDVKEGTVISVTCLSPAKLVTLPQNQNVFYCNGAHWRPLTPQCRLVDNDSMNSTDQTTTTGASEIRTTANNNDNNNSSTTAPRLLPDNTTIQLLAVATSAGNSSAEKSQTNLTVTADINANASTTSSWSSSSLSSSSESGTDAVAEANTSTTATSTSTTQASTTIPVYVIPVEYPCLPINDTYAVVNSSDVREGTVISVTCLSPAKLVTLPQNQNVFYCNGAHWRPLTPRCRIGDNDDGPNVGVIVGCTVGGFVCLLLVIAAVFLLYRSIVDKNMQKERSKEFYEKMDHICSYVNSSFQDSVGMPVLTMDNRDSGLRGRVSQAANDQSSTPAPDPDPNEAGKLGADLF